MHLRKLIFASILLAVVAFGQTTLDTGYQVKYAANLNVADSYFNFANTGAQGASPFGPAIGGTIGVICANVYAFSPDEQMIACCQCPITANGLMSLSAQKDLISNTLTPIVPTSILVKVVATLDPGTGSNAGKCIDTARNINTAPAGGVVPALVSGLAAWGTTVHQPQGAVTETAFTPSTFSGDERIRLGNLCTMAAGNGSGYGICKSCKLGALAAVKK